MLPGYARMMFFIPAAGQEDGLISKTGAEPRKFYSRIGTKYEEKCERHPETGKR